MEIITFIVPNFDYMFPQKYKYKEAYEKQKGHHIGAQSLEDDPKLVHSMKLAKIQSEREYKKAYEKEKTSYQTPVDMLNVILAKRAQALTSNINYKQQIHRYTLPPDALSVQQAKTMQDLRNDVRPGFNTCVCVII